ncbi:hypothetical protein JXM67_06985 [candidate division WOR-3 bacterium]|nr:hypothetical protein [candidate division WOR-3 bacterium]
MSENIDVNKAQRKPILALILVLAGVLLVFILFFLAPLIKYRASEIGQYDYGDLFWHSIPYILLDLTKFCLLAVLVLTLVALFKKRASRSLMTVILVVSCIGVGYELFSRLILFTESTLRNSYGISRFFFSPSFTVQLPAFFLLSLVRFLV